MTAAVWISPQQLDPLGGVSAQAFSWLFTGAGFLSAAGLTLAHRTEYHDAVLLLGAFAALATACVVAVLASSPRRAPFTWRSALALHLLGLVAIVLEAGAQWGTNASVRTDWAPVVLIFLVIVTSSFRPAAEILAMTAVSVVVVVLVTDGEIASSTWLLPPAVYPGLTAGPVLAAGVASAAYSATLVQRLLRWREATEGARLLAAERMRERARDDVRDERLDLIEREIGPFLRELLATGKTDAASAERARQLGDALRRALVEEADGVWLGDMVAELHDPDGLAAGMDEAQRAALEAACTALADRRTVATLERAGSSVRLTLRWAPEGRGRLGPELQAILRHVFPGARMRLRACVVELEFAAARLS